MRPGFMVAVKHAGGRGSVCVEWWAAELEDCWPEEPDASEGNTYQGEGDPAEHGAAGESTSKLGRVGKGETVPDMRW